MSSLTELVDRLAAYRDDYADSVQYNPASEWLQLLDEVVTQLRANERDAAEVDRIGASLEVCSCAATREAAPLLRAAARRIAGEQT